jgi:DUF971 family protein
VSGNTSWPTTIHYKSATRVLTVSFDDKTTFDLPAEYLRVESPSAEVQGHGSSTKVTVAGKRNVGITDIKEVGRYAVRIVFDDGHDTGLFSWEYLFQLGAERSKRWFEYEQRLQAKGLTRGA